MSVTHGTVSHENMWCITLPLQWTDLNYDTRMQLKLQLLSGMHTPVNAETITSAEGLQGSTCSRYRNALRFPSVGVTSGDTGSLINPWPLLPSAPCSCPQPSPWFLGGFSHPHSNIQWGSWLVFLPSPFTATAGNATNILSRWPTGSLPFTCLTINSSYHKIYIK